MRTILSKKGLYKKYEPVEDELLVDVFSINNGEISTTPRASLDDRYSQEPEVREYSINDGYLYNWDFVERDEGTTSYDGIYFKANQKVSFKVYSYGYNKRDDTDIMLNAGGLNIMTDTEYGLAITNYDFGNCSRDRFVTFEIKTEGGQSRYYSVHGYLD